MPAGTLNWADGRRYQPAGITTGQSLPKDAFISGRIVLVWPFTPTYERLIRFRISAKYPINIGGSEYVSTAPTGEEKWAFTINLVPSASTLNSGQSARDTIKSEYDAFLPYLGSEVKIRTDGLKVTNLQGKEVNLEATGSRTLWTEKRGTWTMFQDATQSSTTPSWLEAEEIQPSLSDPPAPCIPQAGPSHFRPISSHLPSRLNLRPTNSPTKRKRTVSPEKRPEPATRALSAVVPPSKKVIELGNGSNFAFTRLNSGFTDTTSLRASSSLGDALASSSSSLEPPPPDQSLPDTVPANPTQLEMPPGAMRQRSPPGPATPAATQRTRSVQPVPTSRAEAEAAARLQGAKRLEEQQALQRAERGAATLLEQGLVVPDVIYTPTKNIRANTVVNVIGIIVSGGPVNLPKGGRPDPILSVVFTDPSVYKGEGAAAEDLVIGIFRKKVADLPVELEPGTPILFRRVKATEYHDKVKGNIYTGGGSWAYLTGGGLKYSDGGIQPALQKAEVDRLTAMRQWWRNLSGTSQVPGPSAELGSPTKSDVTKICLLGDTRNGQFFDAVFKILYVHSGRHMHFELYVTDGSVSPLPLRNFHGVTHPSIPTGAIYCISIKDEPPAHELPAYEVGNIIRLGNIRAKVYRDELEFIWANLVTEGQASQGWKRRRPSVLPKEDERSQEVEIRLANLERAGPNGASHEIPAQKIEDDDGQNIRTRSDTKPPVTEDGDVPVVAVPDLATGKSPLTTIPSTTVVPPSDVPLATHLMTIFSEPIEHQVQTIKEVLTNRTFPNKFRVKARVKSIHARGLLGKESFVQKHCGHCKRAILKTVYCQSCQDVNMKNAAWCYRFLVILEDEESTIPVLIADHEAERFLPPLPPLSSSTSPNDIRKTAVQIGGVNRKVFETLQGGAMDGIRPRPWIDWTLQSSIAQTPKGHVGLKAETGIVVYRAFGMTSP